MSHISKALDELEGIYNAGIAVHGDFELIRKAREELEALQKIMAFWSHVRYDCWECGGQKYAREQYNDEHGNDSPR